MSLGTNELKLLLDSGTSVSIIFKSCIKDNYSIDKSKRVTVHGVAGSTTTLGESTVSFRIDQDTITHEFLVMEDFECDMHGVIGSDFLTKYSAIIDNGSFKFSFFNQKRRISVPLDSKSSYINHSTTM
ncbi:hypothetical protein HHI36_001531 [Cryptolaemus montrouzieri]|uniref:Peptidase A2 domain-containing protein n=1 Tax=Cryptolaemus montrouzieri TaxID=559131 RepID=A0ABD2P978_9CUCU